MMKNKMIFAGALSMAVMGVALPAMGQVGTQRDDVKARSVEWDDIPNDARRALKREQGNDRLEKLVTIEFEGRISYRASFSDKRGEVRTVRVGRDGDLINENDRGFSGKPLVRDREKVANLPAEVRKTILRETNGRPIDEVTRVGNNGRIWYIVDLENGRRFRVDRGGDIIDDEPKLLANFRDDNERRRNFDRDMDDFGRGKHVDYDNLPGNIRHAIGQRTKSNDKVSDVVILRRDGRTEYLAYVENDNFTRVFRVDEKGEVIGGWNATEEGAVRVDVDGLPGPVKETLAKHAPLRDYRRVLQVTRDGKTEFFAYHEERGEQHVRRVARNGELISERDAH